MPTKNLFKHKYKYLAVIYTIWMTAISLTPLDGFHLPSFHMADKIVHFVLYFLFAVLWLLAFPNFKKYPIKLIAFFVLWGIIIEFLQEYFIPTRSGEVLDAVANTFGGLTGLFLFIKTKK